MNAVSRQHSGASMSNNPFATGQVAPRAGQNAVAEASQQREIAEVQAAMVIAKRFPRNQIEAMDRILQACTRPSLADGALYSYGRGGSEVTGPSIRLAEVAAQCWGNVSFGIRELEQRNGESTVEAFAWDIETNTRQVKVFQVPHVRHTRKGQTRLEDPRDIYELVANQGARRLRACILGVIPGDVIEGAVKQCEETLKSSADTSPEAIKRMCESFAKFGVTNDQIAARIQCRVEAIRPAQMVQMKKIYASLRDSMSSPSDWFDTQRDSSAPAKTLADAIGAKSSRDQATEPTHDSTAAYDASAGEIHDALVAATTRDDLDMAADMIRMLPEADRGPLNDLYQQRLADVES